MQLLGECHESTDINSIGTLLKKLNAIDDCIQKWDLFLERIMYAAYAYSNNKETHELCRMAQQWLDYLEKKI